MCAEANFAQKQWTGSIGQSKNGSFSTHEMPVELSQERLNICFEERFRQYISPLAQASGLGVECGECSRHKEGGVEELRLLKAPQCSGKLRGLRETVAVQPVPG